MIIDRSAAAVLLTAAFLTGCPKESVSNRPAADASAVLPQGGLARFHMSDLVAATELDAQVARLTQLAAEYKAAMTFQQGATLRATTDGLEARLAEAATAVARALAAVQAQSDRALAEPLAQATMRWPDRLRATREELLGSPNIPRANAAAALAEVDAEVARRSLGYRKFRASWVIVNAPDEVAAVMLFLRDRKALEQAETFLGGSLPSPDQHTDGGPLDVSPVRASVEKGISRARLEASAIPDSRKPSAERWVEAQARAMNALVSLDGKPGDEERGRLSLQYLAAKAEALAAVAEYTRLTAERVKTQ